MLRNPESDWFRAPAIDRAEVERRIGPVERYEVLSGGLATVNVRVDGERVLRIYRNANVLPKERALLTQPWRSFGVPRVFDAGTDWLSLEYVAHAPLDDEHGALVGRALAEIHARSYAHTGMLAADLTLATRFPEHGFSIGGYVRSQLDAARVLLGDELTERVHTFSAEHDGPLGPPVLSHCDFKLSNLHRTPRGELLVLDWEFAWAGPALLDVGQLMRWNPPTTFANAFADSYRAHGGTLVDGWQQIAEAIDLGNLLGLIARNLGDEATATIRAHRTDRLT